MANVKIIINGTLVDGHEVTFKAPCDCTAIEYLDVRYIKDMQQVSKFFKMKDSHGEDLTGIGNLFVTGAYVKVILDTENGFAYLQNADTNSYIEEIKKSVSDGKVEVAGAITEKGIETATDADFATMVANIMAIETDPTIDVSYADEVSLVVSGETSSTVTSGTVKTSVNLKANSTYIIIPFCAFQGMAGGYIDVNCGLTAITANIDNGVLDSLKDVSGLVGGNWRSYRVDKVVTSESDSVYTASCTTSGYYTKWLVLNIVAVQIT